jgi:replicative DNA helicase Mcm
MPSTLLTRFDLIFPIRDLPSREKDEQMAGFILNLHQSAEKKEAEISSDMIKKYVSYARRKISPKLTDAALKEIKDFFVDIRNAEEKEGTMRTIPITARQLEALVRLSEASAKSELRDKVVKKDAKRAIDLIHSSLSQTSSDPHTGKIDIDTLSSGITSTQRNEIVVVKEIINELEKVLGKSIPLEDIEREAEIRGIEKERVDEIVEKLRRSGDIFSPKHGIISKIS